MDFETGEIELPEGDEKLIVDIKLDSMYIPNVFKEHYAWDIKKDSLLINDLVLFL